MTKFITYTGDDEILVTTKKNEKKVISEWFSLANGRDSNKYIRYETEDDLVFIRTRVDIYIR